MKKKTFIILLTILFVIVIFPESNLKTDNFFTSKDITRIKNGEIITRMYTKNNAVGENTDLIINIPKTKYINEDFSIYEMVTDEKAFIPYKLDSNEKKLNFYNTLCSYSKLKGMKYFSRRIQKIEQLIIDSYLIESINKKKKLNDITCSAILPQADNYFIQKDNKFGELIFKSTIYNDGDNFIMINTCLEPISNGILTMCKKEEYKFITYFIYDKESNGFFYYSANIMRIRLDFVLKKGKFTLYPTTFSNRLRATTVHLVKLLGINWDNKINPWDEDKLAKGYYKNY